MKLISRTKLRERVAKYPDAVAAVETWVGIVQSARWESAEDMVRAFSGRVRTLAGGRAIFDIKGNSYRLICGVKYAAAETTRNGTVFVRFFGTHAEYDKIDPATVKQL